jgi:transposase InsO family protein
VHTAVICHSTDAWVAQQLREATPRNRRPRFLILDNDGKYGKQFSAVARSSGIKEIRTPLEAPRANAICERFIGSLRRECLGYFVFWFFFYLSSWIAASISGLCQPSIPGVKRNQG